jgi:hypothetical protein
VNPRLKAAMSNIRDKKNNQISYLEWRAVPLTQDHKPNGQGEYERLICHNAMIESKKSKSQSLSF